MSLQVWLPLNGDLHNQGLSNINMINNQSDVSDNGKIGKCYVFANTKCYSSTSFGFNSTVLSLSAWAKIDSSSSTGYLCGLSEANSTAFMFYYRSTNSTIEISVNGSIKLAYSAADYLDTWHHYTAVSTGTAILLYIDGVLKNSVNYTVTAFNSVWMYLGCRRNNSNGSGTYYFIGHLNDVRVYDHALSSKEVEEIAKGLVLHYKLDGNQTNWLLPNSETTIKRKSGGSAFADYAYYQELTSCTETNFKVDFWAKGSTSNLQIDFYFRNQSGSIIDSKTTPKTTLTTNWKHYSLSLSLTNVISNLDLFRTRCYQGTANDTVYLRNVRLLSDNTPIRDSTIYDCSGYCHNGAINGNLAAAVGSPRYGVATQFDGSSSHTKKTDFNFSSNTWTISAWFKNTYTGTGYQTICALTKSTGSDANKKFSLYLHGSKVGAVGEGQATGDMTTIDKTLWHHLCWVNNNGTFTLYLNGTNIKTQTKNACLTDCTDFIVGARASAENATTIATPFEGSISDVRIYCTAFTSAQVLELYNTSGSIDASGNVYVRELVES